MYYIHKKFLLLSFQFSRTRTYPPEFGSAWRIWKLNTGLFHKLLNIIDTGKVEHFTSLYRTIIGFFQNFLVTTSSKYHNGIGLVPDFCLY